VKVLTAALAALCLSVAAASVAAVAAPEPSAAQSAAVAGMLAFEKARGVTDIEHPTCRVVSGWARCGFAEGGGQAYSTVIMRAPHPPSSEWTMVMHTGGALDASTLESHGVPTAVAKQLTAPAP
jgi:hypothetical protein